MEMIDFAAIFAYLQTFNDMSSANKISGLVVILVGLWKTSFVRNLLWDKLGAWKVLVGPLLGVIASLVLIQPLSWAGVWEGLLGGTLSIALHHLLDAVKLIPGLGTGYVKFIDWVKAVLKAPPQQLNQ